MRKVFIAFTISLCASTMLLGQGIRFETGSLADAKAAATQQGKMLMVFVCADWLEVCSIMKDEIFVEKEVGEAYNPHFVTWFLDAAALEGNSVYEGVRILSIPEFIFFDTHGKPQYREKRLHDHDDMLAMAKAARDPKNHLSVLEKQYASGDRAPAFLQRYIVEMDAAGEDMAQTSRDYLEKLSPDALLETPNWIIATIGVRRIEDRTYQYVLNHLATFKKQYGAEAVEGFIVSVYRSTLDQAVTQQDLNLLQACQNVVRKLLAGNAAESVVFQDELTFYAAGNNWPAYAESALKLFQVYKGADPILYNDVAWNIYKNASTDELREQALVWTEKSIDLESAYWNHHTRGCLLHQLKRDAEALEEAKIAQRLAEPDSEEMRYVEELLELIGK